MKVNFSEYNNLIILTRFERVLPGIFVELHKIYTSIDGKMKSESFKSKILNCIRAWTDWTIYPNEFLISLQNTFLGYAKATAQIKPEVDEDDQENEGHGNGNNDEDDEDVDGKPLDEEDNDTEDDDDRMDVENRTRARIERYGDESSSLDGKPSNYSTSTLIKILII